MSREIESLQERNKDLLAENDALRQRLSGVHISDDNSGTIRIERPRSLNIDRPRSLHIDIPPDAAAADGNGPPSSLGTTPITVSPYSSGLSASASPYSSKRNSQTFMSSFASSRPELISGVSTAHVSYCALHKDRLTGLFTGQWRGNLCYSIFAIRNGLRPLDAVFGYIFTSFEPLACLSECIADARRSISSPGPQ